MAQSHLEQSIRLPASAYRIAGYRSGFHWAMIVLSPLEDDCTTWPEAVQFATEHQVRLPTPEELIWLRVNMPEAFLPEWYWSSEGLRGSRRPYATAQNFRGGRQYPLLKTEEIRVRFVQLNPLDNPAKMSILSQTLEI